MTTPAMPDLDKTQEHTFKAWFECEYPIDHNGKRAKYRDMTAQQLMLAAWQAARSLPPLQVEEGIDTAELRKLALAATPGPWEVLHETDDECSHAGYSIHAATKTISDDNTAPCDRDALFIAAANPAAILRLLDALDARQVAPETAEGLTDADAYYLQDSRDYVGNDMLFWAKDGNGYTTDIRKAEVYTKERAVAQHQSRETDIPWPKAYIDARTRPAVDMQYVKRAEALADTGIVLVKPQKPKREVVNCHACGKFMSHQYADCAHCGADNRP